MRKLILALSAVISFSAAIGQQKQLTTSQMLSSGGGRRGGGSADSKAVIKDIPRVTGWVDDTHYLLSRPKEGGGFETVSVDVKTGAEQPYAPPEERRATVSVRSNDIFYKSEDGKEKQLTNNKEEEKNPTLSPDGQKVAFTRNNDLYIADVASGNETRLTNDGTDLIYNGWASWVYFEEILGRPTRYRAFWWSPDSKHIAYMHFNDTKVPLFPIYGSDGQHGYLENTRYPLVGDTNPEVKVGIADITTAKTTWADFNEKDDQYFGTPFWSPDGKSLWQQWMDRPQHHLIVYAIDPATGSKRPVYDEQQKTWVDWLDDIHFMENNKGYIVKSDKSGWMHIYQYDMNGNPVNQITNGNWTVRDILKIDEKKGMIWFTARKENSARFDLYSIRMNGKDLQRLTFGDYTHTVSLSPETNYFITTYSNVATPTRIALVDIKSKSQKEIADSKGAEFDQYQIAKTDLLRTKSSDGLFDLPFTITWPTNFDRSKKYPVLISIYGGPNAGTVTDSWKGLQPQWYAKEGLIQVSMDHRGSGHFGKAGQNYMYKDLGDWELKDYTDIVKWLEANANVDPAKVCITGFSYGGYMTCMALTKAADVFTHGMAGGSVADWSLYDTHYTERFMGTKQDNPEGYKTSSVFPYINNYKGMLQIVHGNMDDNVHMQNSIQIIAALEDAKKDFEFMIYPGGRHGWGNLPARSAHFNNLKTKFIYRYLLEKPVPKEVLQ